MSKVKDLLRFLVSFLLMFAVILMQFSFFVGVRLLNGDFYKDTLNKSEYFSLMRKDIDYGFKNLSMITSIPEESFISAVSNEAIKELALRNINSVEAYMKYENKYIDNKIDSNVIYESLQKYIAKNNLKEDENLKAQLKAVSEDAGNTINNYAVLFNINVVDKYPQFQSFRKNLYLLYSIRVMAIIAVVLMIMLLVLLNKNRPRRVFLWVGSSFIPAAIMTLVPSILAIYYKIPYRFSIENEYLKVALKDISIGYINYFIVTGTIILLAGIACTATYAYLSNKSHNSLHHGFSQKS